MDIFRFEKLEQKTRESNSDRDRIVRIYINDVKIKDNGKKLNVLMFVQIL